MATAYRRKRHGKRRSTKRYRKYRNPSLSLSSVTSSGKRALGELPTAAWAAAGLFANGIAYRGVARAVGVNPDDYTGLSIQIATALALGFVPKVGNKLATGAAVGVLLNLSKKLVPQLSTFSGFIEEDGTSSNPLPGFGEFVDTARLSSGGRFGEFVDEARLTSDAKDELFAV